jgi:hypothetical protein
VDGYQQSRVPKKGEDETNWYVEDADQLIDAAFYAGHRMKEMLGMFARVRDHDAADCMGANL